jgi:GGDEF domain-containing protein
VIAGYTLWVGILTNPPGNEVWLMVFFAACVGGWSSKFPARQAAVLLLRAVLLLSGTMLLHGLAGSGGATGPFFNWLVLIAIFYALLLPTPLALVLSALALLEFGLACWLVPPLPRWTDILVHMGFLLMAPPLAMKFGQSMRQSDVRAESSLRDNRTLLYNETGFFVHGAMLLDDCNKRDRPFSMVLLNGRDLRDIPGLLGRKVTNDLFAQIVQGIGAVPGEGIAARTDSVEFALLLPGVTMQGAVALVRQQLGDPPKVEVQIAGKPVVIGLDMAVSQSTDKTQSLEGLYDALHLRWAERQNLKRRKGDKPDGPAQADKTVKTAPTLPGFDDAQAIIVRHEASPTVPMPLSGHQQKN